MAVGRGEPQTRKAGYMSAIKGRDGRTSPPPPGGVYVRDPAAARAEAIRERVAMHQRRGEPIPPHLQRLVDQLPPVGDDLDVDLVDEKTGRYEGEVKLVDTPEQVESTPPQAAPLPLEAVEVTVVGAGGGGVSGHEGSGSLDAQTAAVEKAAKNAEPQPAEPAAPETPEAKPVRRGRPPKKAAQE